MKIGILGPISIEGLGGFNGLPPMRLSGLPFEQNVDVVKKLVHLGHEVCVFTSSMDVDNVINYYGDRVSVMVAPRRRRAILQAIDLFEFERSALLERLKEIKLDVLHAHWTYEYAHLALESSHNYVVTAHDAPPKIAQYSKGRDRFYRSIRARYARNIVGKISNLIFPSIYLRDYYIDTMDYKNKKWVIENFIPQGLLYGEREAREDITITAVSNGFNGYKNTSSVIEAFAILRQIVPNTKLILFGNDHEHGGKAWDWAVNRKLGGGIIFRGRVSRSDLLEFIATETDIFVHPSLEESFGLAVAEAIALGVPVIGGKYSGGVPEILALAPESTMSIDVKNKFEMSRSMLNMINNISKFRNAAQIDKESIKNTYNIEMHASKLLRVYEEVAT